MNYKGKATIDFCVYRGDDEKEIELSIYGSSYFQRGRTYGPPESCYPDEGETEIETITLDGKPWDGELTSEETKEAEAKLEEAVMEDQEEPDPPSVDYDDEPPSYRSSYDED